MLPVATKSNWLVVMFNQLTLNSSLGFKWNTVNLCCFSFKELFTETHGTTQQVKHDNPDITHPLMPHAVRGSLNKMDGIMNTSIWRPWTTKDSSRVLPCRYHNRHRTRHVTALIQHDPRRQWNDCRPLFKYLQVTLDTDVMVDVRFQMVDRFLCIFRMLVMPSSCVCCCFLIMSNYYDESRSSFLGESDLHYM